MKHKFYTAILIAIGLLALAGWLALAVIPVVLK